jgi:hypothetical protein
MILSLSSYVIVGCVLLLDVEWSDGSRPKHLYAPFDCSTAIESPMKEHTIHYPEEVVNAANCIR